MSSSAVELDLRGVIKMALGLLALLALAYGMGIWFREPITEAGVWVHSRFGMPGLALAMILADSLPFSVTHEPLLFLGMGAGINPWELWLWAGAGSTLAGPVGWLGGNTLARSGRLVDTINRRFGPIINYVRQKGGRAVFIISVTPFPFSLGTWAAGMVGVPLPTVAVASLGRMLKVGVQVALLQAGWDLGTGD